MWAICNNCNDNMAKEPCIIWVPGDTLYGETGCPYHVHGENNNYTDPAHWVAIPRDRIEEYIAFCGDDIHSKSILKRDVKKRKQLVEIALHVAKGDAEKTSEEE